jgi:hypothetical protein
MRDRKGGEKKRETEGKKEVWRMTKRDRGIWRWRKTSTLEWRGRTGIDITKG